MGDNDCIVQVRDLRKQYDALTAVDGVTFDIVRGEIFGLLGPNGAGKTTTISILAGILAPTAGEVQVAGHDVRRGSVAMKRALGVVPQDLAIYPKLTGRENLEFFGRLYGMRGAALTERVGQMLQLVGLADRADSRADTYSGGMKRRLNLAAGLMHNPQLLLLDEPTVGVDPQSRNHIFEGVRALNRQGLTILYTSHYMEEVEALCDRVGIMDNGKLIACDTVSNLVAGMGGAVIEVSIGATLPTEAQLAALRALESVESVEFVPTPPTTTTDAPAEAPVTPSALAPGEGIGGILHVRSKHPNQALPGLIAAITAAGLSLIALTIKQPNLEDVFLALTGKHLRD
jgi:ABC-2 type transport system ATP-binding protein